MINRNTPIWQLSVEELENILDKKIKQFSTSSIKNTQNIEEDEIVHGIKGLAELLGCSVGHAQRLKSRGLFDKALIQNGRKIIIYKKLALELFNQKF